MTNLPISASHRGKLLSSGYTTLASLSSISSEHLAEGISSLVSVCALMIICSLFVVFLNGTDRGKCEVGG